MTAQSWEPRVSRLEGAIEQIGDRLADLHGDMTTLRAEMTALRSEMRDDIRTLDEKIDRNLHVTIGWMVGGNK